MRKTTYEEFYKSVEYLDVAEYENTFGVEANHDGVKGVFCYLGCGLHIDVMPHGYGLILDRTYHESDQLHELEKLLYDFCDEEGYLDEVEPSKDIDIDKYINWDALADDYDLKSGDLSPTQLGTLEGLFETFINQNR